MNEALTIKSGAPRVKHKARKKVPRGVTIRWDLDQRVVEQMDQQEDTNYSDVLNEALDRYFSAPAQSTVA